MRFLKQKIFLFSLFILLPSPGLAQDCAPPQGPGLSAQGYAVQGRNDCFMAADVNSGVSAGHSVNPDVCPTCSGHTDALDGMYAVRQCLEDAGFATPGGGTKDGKDGFTDALCKCNEAVFGKKFVCDQMSTDDGFSRCDLELIDELLKNQCLVIATFSVFNPSTPSTPHIGNFGNHAVSIFAASAGTGTVSASDPNNPDSPTDVPVNPDGSVPQGDDPTNPPNRLAGGAVPLKLLRITIKCPATDEAAAVMESKQECRVPNPELSKVKIEKASGSR